MKISKGVCVFQTQYLLYITKIIMKIIMDEEELDEFIYEFHERVLGIIPEHDERSELIEMMNNYE